jgi:NAD-dependent deacetylase
LPEPLQIPDALIAALRGAHHICVLTGAGVSAESGVPTFRDAQSGLWAKYDPMDLATPQAFVDNPKLIWRWYRWRRELVSQTEPNPAHLALAALADLVPKLTLVTQNVDGLHQRAGSAGVIEFHGNLFDDRCFRDGRLETDLKEAAVPRCSDCDEPLRPGVVWFGEAIPEAALEQSFAAARECDVFLSIGTSSLVFPAAGLIDLARDAGATTVEINPNPTSASAGLDFMLQGNAGLIIPKLVISLSE